MTLFCLHKTKVQDDGDAVPRGQALGSTLTEAGTKLAEMRWRGVQDDGDAVARGQALGCSLVEAGTRVT